MTEGLPYAVDEGKEALCGIGEPLRRPCLIAARLADGRQHLPRQPFLERQRRGLVRTPKEEVEALLGEANGVFGAEGGQNGSDHLPLFRT